MKSFLTGSRAYGNPTEKSDIDYVILCSPEEFNLLCDNAEICEGSAALFDSVRRSVRYGILNLILLIREDEFEAWRKGTEECINIRPVTRDFAIGVITNYLHNIGIHYSELTPQLTLIDDDIEYG